MLIKRFKTSRLYKTLVSHLVILSIFIPLFPSISFAYDGVRGEIDFRGDRCYTGEINWDPFMDNKDINWVFSNPTCAAYIGSVGAAMVAAGLAARFACQPLPFGPELPLLHGTVPWGLITLNVACAGKMSRMEPTGSGCCAAAATKAATVVAAVIALVVIWDVARMTYQDARICGHNWQKWEQNPPDSGKWQKADSYKKCLKDLLLDGKDNCGNVLENKNATFEITNKNYREFIYGGIEFPDNGDDACKNPSTWTAAYRKKVLGYTDDSQRYYMTGPANLPSFACHRFLTSTKGDNDIKATKEAYECCKNRSQTTLCIENKKSVFGIRAGDYEYKFCQLGSICRINKVGNGDQTDVKFDIYPSKRESSYICAKTYSVCPYDHPLGGGTEIKESLTGKDVGRIANFCQFMNHCSKLPPLPRVNTRDYVNDYISQACYDMKGDSQNVYGYSSELIPLNTKGFSAPMVQCFKETMENVFLNKAGHSLCQDEVEMPNYKGECVSGYIRKQGDGLSGESFFIKVQNKLRFVIKMVLVMSVTFFGFGLLIAVHSTIDKKKLLAYVMKLGLVVFFALGSGWHTVFIDGVLGISHSLSKIVFDIDIAKSEDQRDGCQFPRFNYADQSETTKYDHPKYPPGKDYLTIWDTLDCKIAFALGFGPSVNVPNLMMVILAGFFTGPYGLIFSLGSFFMAIFLIMITVRAMHIFLLSMTSVILLIYVSPIVIPLSLFERTKDIFKNWWTQMLSFILQPVVLFLYMSILIVFFDKEVLTSHVRFQGDGKINPKKILCNKEAKEKSAYCILKDTGEFGNVPGLEVIGVFLPTLGDSYDISNESASEATVTVLSDTGNTIKDIGNRINLLQERGLALLKVGLILFILYTMLDQLSNIITKLVGGASLKGDWGEKLATEGPAAVYKAVRGIQKRGMSVARSAATNTVSKAKGVKEGVEAVRDAIKNRDKSDKSDSKPSEDSGDEKPKEDKPN